MAIFHMSIKVIGRSKGRSAMATAAYCSGEKLHSEETDRTFDYSRKSGVVFSEITLCANAPEDYLNREQLWNAVQTVENKSDSRLARLFECALPKETNLEEQKEICRKFASSLADSGMIVDWSIHDKGDGNPHVHMMATTRPITKNGTWGSKQRKEYALDKDGNKIPVIDPKTGEQKIEKKTGRKVWKRVTVESTRWDDRSNVEEWRKSWADICNSYLKADNKIDHRSYERQGIDLIPTIHEGYSARKADGVLMRTEGRHGDIVGRNIEIKKANKELVGIKLLMGIISALVEKIKKEIEKLKLDYKEVRNVSVGELLQRSRSLRTDDGTGEEYRGQGGVNKAEPRAEIPVGRTGKEDKRYSEQTSETRRNEGTKRADKAVPVKRKGKAR